MDNATIQSSIKIKLMQISQRTMQEKIAAAITRTPLLFDLF
jgi:hypothetical protein